MRCMIVYFVVIVYYDDFGVLFVVFRAGLWYGRLCGDFLVGFFFLFVVIWCLWLLVVVFALGFGFWYLVYMR